MYVFAIPAVAYQALVISCHDGDTVRIRHNEKVERIRLSGIDAPEIDQPFGIQSRNYLENIVLGRTVEIEETGKDKYGRTVAEIFTADRRDVNHLLVRQGLAWWYPAYARKDHALEYLESMAKVQHLGLWANRAAEAPWVFRKEKAAERKVVHQQISQLVR